MTQTDLFHDAKIEKATVTRITLHTRPVESLPSEARSTFPPRDLAARADAWIREHPGGWALFKRFALEAASGGHKFGAKALAERIRWAARIEKGQDGFVLNNSIVSYVARRLVQDDPTLAPFIEFREARCAAKPR